MKCKKCGGELYYYYHPVEVQTYEIKGNGSIEQCPMKVGYDGRVIEEYAQCDDCRQIYEYDSEKEVVNLDKELDDYPSNLGM
jgi:transcription initiation factor IIE alpha subunit